MKLKRRAEISAAAMIAAGRCEADCVSKRSRADS